MNADEIVGTEPSNGDGTVGEPQAQPEPVAQPDPEGQPEKFTETPEQVADSRKYFQSKAQQETEQRKVLQQRLADLETAGKKLEVREPIDFGQQLRNVGVDPNAQPRNERGQFQPASTMPEYDPDNPATWIDAVAERSANITMTKIQQQRAEEDAARNQRELDNNIHDVTQQLGEIAEKCKIPDVLVREAVKYATDHIPFDGRATTPRRQGKLALDYMKQNLAVSFATQAEDVQRLTDAKKIEAAKLIQQPLGVSIGAPAPITQRDINQQYADEIAPDDPPVGGSG